MTPESIADEVMPRIERMRENSRFVLIGIEGRCGSGKTKLAATLRSALGWPVIHMDDFYLLPEERTDERVNEPGGNVAYERFAREVLEPLSTRRTACFNPYDCGKQALAPLVTVGAAPVVIVEGSYCLHPKLRTYYDLKIFMDVDRDEQLRRLSERESPDSVEMYRTAWIPREESYIRECGVRESADMYFLT